MKVNNKIESYNFKDFYFDTGPTYLFIYNDDFLKNLFNLIDTNNSGNN